MATGFSKRSIAAPGLLIFGLVGGAPAYAGVATDGTAGARVQLDGDFEIGAELGRRAGGNLFHSFERFSLDAGERATFSGPDQIRNVISRVTGGERSDIDGTIRSTIPGADFYFLNPAGVMFGPNASLDLQGSFHVSTADELRFADGTTFSATSPSSSSFTIAPPEAFGFLGAEPRAISLARSTLAVPVGEALSLIGGDITIDGGNAGAASGGDQGLVRAEAGQITLAAISGPGEARPGSGEVLADEAAAITLAGQASVDASGDGGGTIRIRGGAFLVDDAAVVADNTGDQAGAGGLDIRVGVADIRSGRLTANARAGGPAGAVNLIADRVTITDGGRIDSTTSGAGAGGDVTLDVGRLELLRDGARVAAASFGPGPAGDLMVTAGEILAVGADPTTRSPSGLFASSVNEGADAGDGGSVMIDVGVLELRDGAQVAAVTRGPGAAGNLTVQADHIIATAPQAGSGIPSGLFANSLGDSPDAGDGGNIVLDVDHLELLGGGQVFSGTFGPGDGGDATVSADEIVAAGADAATGFPSGIFAGSQGAGDSGNVAVSAAHLTLLDGGQIGSSALEESMGAGGVVRVTADSALLIAGESAGGSPSGIFASAQGATVSEEDAGNVTVSAGELEIRDGGEISGSTFTAGNAGAVEVVADTLIVRNGASVSSGTFAEGDAGTVKVAAAELQVRGGFVRSTSEGAGDAGRVTVTADRISLLEGGQLISSPLEQSTGAGGEVRVTAADTLLIAARNPGGFASGIFATAEGAEASDQDAGNVTVRAGELEIRDGGVIAASTFTAGNAGAVEVIADTLFVRNGVGVSSGTFAEGDAGSVKVTAGELQLRGGFVRSTSQGAGDAGRVTVTADRISLLEGGQLISSPLEQSTGAGGEVSVTASDSLLIAGVSAGDFPSGIFASAEGARSATKAAGDVTVTTGALEIRDGGVITSSTLTGGNAGTVDVTANALTIRNGSDISSRSFAEGDAGIVTVSADRLMLLDNGQISSSPLRESTGAGGKVRVSASDTLLIAGFGSGIFASAEGALDAAENAGDVAVSAGKLEIRDGGVISSSTFTAGNAGTVTVEADRIDFVNDGRIFNGTDGAGNGGDITVRTKTIFADVGSNPTGFHTGISASANPMSGGEGGDVMVTADRIWLINGAEISSDTDSIGAAGAVTVFANEIELSHGGQIFTTSSSTGDAGSIAIVADRIDLDGGRINTDTATTGGGEIRLSIRDVIMLRDSAITTSVTGGADPTAGSILIDPKVLVIDASRIQANAGTGSGGQLRIEADNILVPRGDFQALLDRGDISASGGTPERAGTITVNAPDVDLSGGLVVLEGALLDAAAQLRERCGVRRDIGASSFTGVGRGGLPPSPDGPLAGAYLAAPPSRGGSLEDRATMAASFDRPVLVAAPCLSAP